MLGLGSGRRVLGVVFVQRVVGSRKSMVQVVGLLKQLFGQIDRSRSALLTVLSARTLLFVLSATKVTLQLEDLGICTALVKNVENTAILAHQYPNAPTVPQLLV